MVDLLLMHSLLVAVPGGSALVIVVNVDYLPSVGPEQVLADIIASGAVPVVRLTEVFLQAARSRMVTAAHGINRGTIPDLSRGDSPPFVKRVGRHLWPPGFGLCVSGGMASAGMIRCVASRCCTR